MFTAWLSVRLQKPVVAFLFRLLVIFYRRMTAPKAYAHATVLIMHCLCGCEKAYTVGLPYLNFNLIKAYMALVVGFDESNFFSFRR